MLPVRKISLSTYLLAIWSKTVRKSYVAGRGFEFLWSFRPTINGAGATGAKCGGGVKVD